ncbi:unnamed protein product [Miscanthus lutarioriparius]|uniref:Trafficking protein particle complex subunit 2-like protein n=2 Tax=Miscanthus TaxID=62336 RepID=A0A811NF31_9POAL|nr:unnamed protein product [Miscanthus lutarioriparius]
MVPVDVKPSSPISPHEWAGREPSQSPELLRGLSLATGRRQPAGGRFLRSSPVTGSSPLPGGIMIVCVAVVGHQNNPLYLQSFTEADDALKLHHIVHCSLDVIDERVNNPKRSAPTLNETFLGLLYPTENYKVYGYLTNTKVKFIMVTTDLEVKDADARNFFRKFHAAYVDAVSNPFHVPGKKIASRSFGARVSTIVKSFGSGTTS